MKKIKFKKTYENNPGEILAFIFLAKIFIGFLFLIPPILGAIFFTLNVFDIKGDTVTLRDLGDNWTGEAFSAAPIYLGLMALAGVFMLHFGVKDSIDISNERSIDSIEITEEEKQ